MHIYDVVRRDNEANSLMRPRQCTANRCPPPASLSLSALLKVLSTGQTSAVDGPSATPPASIPHFIGLARTTVEISTSYKAQKRPFRAASRAEREGLLSSSDAVIDAGYK